MFGRQLFLAGIARDNYSDSVGNLVVEDGSSRRLPRRSAGSFISTRNIGTRINTWIVEVIIPPTIGAAISF